MLPGAGGGTSGGAPAPQVGTVRRRAAGAGGARAITGVGAGGCQPRGSFDSRG